MFRVPESNRVEHPTQGIGGGNNGYFVLQFTRGKRRLHCIASDGEGWEHVSVVVRVKKKTFLATWQEMCFVKRMFWDDEDTVVQYHPPASAYVNFHPHCLHLWRPTHFEMPVPDSILVGPLWPREEGESATEGESRTNRIIVPIIGGADS